MKRSALKAPDTSARLTIKAKRCKVCKADFFPHRPMQNWCTPECAYVLGMKAYQKKHEQARKQERAQDRKAKEAMKTLPQLLKEAQGAFNAFCRERDRMAGHPCISSGRPLDWSGNATDCGHYRSVGAAPQLRFNESNAHAQSKHDNQYKAGNVVEYRINLIKRIGLEAVEALEADNIVRKWTKDEVREIRDDYRARVRAMRKEQT